MHLCMTPQPWLRTGPGTATEGKPTFDLRSSTRPTSERLRERVIAAGNAGIYVAVMLFDGFALHLSPAPDNVQGHPFYGANNVNGIGITSIVIIKFCHLTRASRRSRRRTSARSSTPYTTCPMCSTRSRTNHRVAGRSTRALPRRWDWATLRMGRLDQWQYWVIEFLKQSTSQQRYTTHPIGMTMQFPVPTSARSTRRYSDSPADWISPGYDDETFASAGGHPNGRREVVREPTRQRRPQGYYHRYRPLLARARRRAVGLEVVSARPPSDPDGLRADRRREPARSHRWLRALRGVRACSLPMGDTLRFARMHLIKMEPRGNIRIDGVCAGTSGRGLSGP